MSGRRARLAFTLIGAICAAGEVRASSPLELFEQGNTAYEESRYDDAADAYEQILQYGVRDPRVHYNLGNARFKAGRLGIAILHYERALRLDPTDREARENLEFARGLIRDRIDPPEIPYPILVLRSWLDTISPGATAVVFVFVYITAATLLGALALARGSVWRQALAYGALAAWILVALCGGALYHKVREMRANHAIVMEDLIEVRSGPAADNTVLFTVHEGTRLEIRNRLGDWYQISLPNALSGWVPADGVERV
ncbi:MAG: tetratricopeptide repeat protein [Acidobacteria bacterium]|nr:tetratricopeptide repeat protein [Acidobacteriota bacterium]